MQILPVRLLLLIVLVLAAGTALASPRIAVEGLLPNSAVLNVDGQRKMLRVGQSFNGVTLVAADASVATLEFNGRRVKLGLSQHIGSNFESPEEQQVTIPRNKAMQYQTIAMINGRSTVVLVDTGANIVAMSTTHAKSLGVNYRDGKAGRVRTASGLADSKLVTLQSVSVGGIRIDNVPASVVEGDYPAMVLLGMSYLQHVDLNEKNGILTLSRTR